MPPPKQAPIEEFDIDEYEAPPERSLLGRGWDAISSPLWEGPSRGARVLSGFMKDSGEQMESQSGRMEGDNSWSDTFKKLAAQGRGFAEGGVEGIGDLLSGFTSPIDLAAMALSGGSSVAGRAGFKGAARGLSAASRAASVPVTAHGAVGVLDPSSTLAERGRGLLEVAGGAAGMAHAPTPRGSVNPALAETIASTERPRAIRPTGPRPTSIGNTELPPGLSALADELNAKPGPTSIRPHVEEPPLPEAVEWKPPTPTDDIVSTSRMLTPDRASEFLNSEMNKGHDRFRESVDAYDTSKPSWMRRPGDAGGTEWKPRPGSPIDEWAKQYDEPSVALLDEGNIQNNGSGDSSASVEAMNRQKQMTSQGKKFVVYDQSGKARPLLGTDAVDYVAKRGETYGIEGPNGFQVLDHKGGKAPTGGGGTGIPKDSLVMPTPDSNPTLYHGTNKTFETFNPDERSPFATFAKWPNFSENPEYTSLYSMGEYNNPNGTRQTRSAHRNIEGASPQTIPAKINTKNIVDLTKPLTDDMKIKLYESLKTKERGITLTSLDSPEYASDLVRRHYETLPFDAVKWTEHGQTNWAVNPKVNIKTPWGTRLTANEMSEPETPGQMKSRLASEGKPTPVLEEEVGISRPTAKQARLQADLAGAKPRFNIGADSYTPKFESDIDKALFIIAQMNPSKRDADYLNFAMRQLGINEGQARQLGSKLRTEIKGIVKQVGGGGDIEIPTLHQDLLKGGRTPQLSEPVPGMGATPPPAPPKPPNRGGGGNGGGIPPEEPEMHVTGGEHIGDIQNGKKSAIVEAFNLPRGLMASYDFSAPLRQGLGLIHKKEFWKALKPMMQSWASEDSFQASQRAIADRPLFRPRVGPGGKVMKSFAEEAGLKLGDLTDLSKREEAIMSTWAETGGDVIPGYKQTIGRGVRMSNRAYTAFLNNLRADTFDSLVNTSKVFGADAKADLPLARALADFVNTASGRGSLGSLENSAVALNTVLFSPRLIASRIQMMNPQNYLMGPPAVRKEYLKSLFAIAAAGNTITQLGKMAGGTVENDPASSDFGKLKIGNTRIDPWGGFQQYGVLINRLLTGRYKSSSSGKMTDLSNPKGPYDQTKLGTLGRFAWGKTHPVVNFAIALMNGGKELSGEKMDFTTMDPMKNALAQRFIPIILQDMYELSQEEPELLPLAIPSAFGMGIQTYGAK